VEYDASLLREPRLEELEIRFYPLVSPTAVDEKQFDRLAPGSRNILGCVTDDLARRFQIVVFQAGTKDPSLSESVPISDQQMGIWWGSIAYTFPCRTAPAPRRSCTALQLSFSFLSFYAGHTSPGDGRGRAALVCRLHWQRLFHTAIFIAGAIDSPPEVASLSPVPC
jgi:hypothetical protein